MGWFSDVDERPSSTLVGWCHSCETWQRGRDARWLELPWDRGSWDWVCVRCDDEPWGLGVWTHDDFQSKGACADALCVEYGGNCVEHRL